MAGPQEIHKETTEGAVTQGSPDRTAARVAEQSFSKEAYNRPGEKDAPNQDDNRQKTVAEKIRDEAYELWSSATSWFGSSEHKTDQKGAGAGLQTEAGHLVISDPYKQADTGSPANSDQTAAKGGSERSWMQATRDWAGSALTSAGEYFKGATDFVENGYQKASTVLSDAWSTVIKGKDYQDDVQVTGKMTNGKTTEVMVKTDNDTRQLTADEVRYKDAQGNTIVENRKSHDITAQSADGKTVYEKRADGTEVVRDATGELISDKKNHTYTRIDSDGTVTEFKIDKDDAKDTAVISKFQEGFAIAQSRMGFSWNELQGHEGQSTTFKDAVGHMHKNGVRSVVRQDGTTELQDSGGDTFRVRQGLLEHLDKDGHYKPVKDGDPEMNQVKTKPGGGWTIMGVEVGRDGSVTGESGEKIGRTSEGITITGTDSQGRPVHGLVHSDGSSEVVDSNGSKTTMDPNHPEHLISRCGADGVSEISYNENSSRFSLDNDGVSFDPGWTTLGFCDSTIFDDGSIQLADGSSLIDNSEQAETNSEKTADSAVQGADQACAAVVSEVAAGTCSFGDVSNVVNAIGNLNNALSVAMACGDLDTATEIIKKKAQLEGVISDAEVKAQVAKELESKGTTDKTAVASAERNTGTDTIF